MGNKLYVPQRSIGVFPRQIREVSGIYPASPFLLWKAHNSHKMSFLKSRLLPSGLYSTPAPNPSFGSGKDNATGENLIQIPDSELPSANDMSTSRRHSGRYPKV